MNFEEEEEIFSEEEREIHEVNNSIYFAIFSLANILQMALI